MLQPPPAAAHAHAPPASPGFNFLQAPTLPSSSLPPSALPSPAAPDRQESPEDEKARLNEKFLVMKFGGSSLATAEHLRRVAQIIQERLPMRPIIVLSAMGKTTNRLLQAAQQALEDRNFDATSEVAKFREDNADLMSSLEVTPPASVKELFDELEMVLKGINLLQEVSGRTRDLIASFGERISVRTFAAFFNSLLTKDLELTGMVEARPVDSWDCGLRTSAGSGSAESAYSEVEILPGAYNDIAIHFAGLRLDYEYLPVVTGYIAKDEQGKITTLGRDGSDLTATLIGAAVHAAEVQIWKDVSGVLTTDPQVVPTARPVSLLTFDEAAELSWFGAKVVHPAAVLPAQMAKVPMSVRSSTQPELPGTRIVAELTAEERRACPVIAMSSKRNVASVVIQSTRMLGQHGFLAHVFNVFAEFKVSVDVIATSEVTVSVTLDPGFKEVDLEGMLAKFKDVAETSLNKGMAMLTLIVDKRETSYVLAETFRVFKELSIRPEMVSHAASSLNITFIIPDSVLQPCIQSLHAVFFEQ